MSPTDNPSNSSPLDPGCGWPAPAKLNRFLHITGRRADGYHLLQTVFQFLDYGDTLGFGLRDDAVVRRSTSLPGIDPETDLTVRAARLLQRHAGVTRGVEIAIDKRIPPGGGLGGGSSDAATTMWALNCLWKLGLSVDELAALGLRLGADVPVFVRGQAAWAEGVGEILTPLTLDEPWYLVVIPNVQVSTAEIFTTPELTRDCNALTIGGFLSGDHGVNVCEPVVRARFPQVADALDWLGRYAPARMSGTGACVFAGFTERGAADEARRLLPAGWRAFVARGCNRSPLLARVELHCAEFAR
ncbi:MAG: 4-(cytidine 5'-diphospho)-2-C-methyl-D-erythritol kinase [Gammaproteobacteria bacterium]|nr:4-(cytidine 5'-diphospho)-2-C-methyl-D-erythritol kinase [Gammaproteobacteria bacterium]